MIAVLGLDGLDPDWVERFAAEGRLPNLTALRREGLSGRLRSSFPPVSLPAWSTFLTGVGPGHHGLFDFTRLVGGRIQFQNSADRGVPTLLELLDAAGRRCCSLGVPTTYPVPPLRRGAVLAGFDSPFAGRPDPRAMHPAELWRRLSAEGLDLRLTTLPEGRKRRGWHARAAREIGASISRRTEQAIRVMKEADWDLLLVHFQASDTAGHHFMRYVDDASERYDPTHPERARVLPDVYAALDDAVGKIFDACPGLSLRLVLSDHGMGSASRSVIHLNRWLEQEGFLVRRTGLRRRAVRAVRDAAVRHLPRELQARLFRALRDGLAASLESSFRLGDVDLERSVAFSEESSTLPGIWLLDPTARDALLRRLRAWDGVVRAWRREDRYRGPLRRRAPHILLELRHSSVKTPPGYRGAPIRPLGDAELDGERGTGLNGVHRPEGVLLAAGVEVEGPDALHDAWIGDLAPSLLAALDVSIPGWMEGRALAELPGVPRLSDSPTPLMGPRPDGGLSPAQAARVERRLRALGYLG